MSLRQKPQPASAAPGNGASEPQGGSPLALLALVTCCALTALDLLLFSPFHAPSLLSASVLALGIGLGLSGALLLVFRVLRNAHPALAALVWSMFGGGFAFEMMSRLGGFQRLYGTYHRLAVAGLGASLALGALLAAVGLMLQPSRRRPLGLLLGLPRVVRAVASVGSVAGLIGVLWVESQAQFATYPVARDISLWAGVCFLLLSLLLNHDALAALLARARRLTRFCGKPLWVLGGGVWLLVTLGGIAAVDGAVASAIDRRPFAGLMLQTSRWLLDLDRDGYSPLLAGGDCDDLNANVNPARRELPGNGIDDNCLAGDALRPAEAAAVEAQPAPSAPAPMSVVLITVDALSAQHSSLYGYPRSTTPNLEAWAQNRAVVFDRAYTAGASTVVALSAVFRGAYPRRLRWTLSAMSNKHRYLAAPSGVEPTWNEGESLRHWYLLPIEEQTPTLTQRLKERGLRTFASTPLHFADPQTGITGKFDEFVSFSHSGTQNPDDAAATRQALKWLSQTPKGKPFFLWIHYLGPHSPTHRDPAAPWFGPSVADGYDHEIATFDLRVAPLLTALAQRTDAGEAIAVVITADHGEEIGATRHHAHVLSDAVARVPLLIAAPGAKPRRIGEPTSTVDIFPTLMALTGAAAAVGADGIDLRPVLMGAPADADRVVLADAWVTDPNYAVVSNKVLAASSSHLHVRDLIRNTDLVSPINNAPGTAGEGNPRDKTDEQRRIHKLWEYLEATAVIPNSVR